MLFNQTPRLFNLIDLCICKAMQQECFTLGLQNGFQLFFGVFPFQQHFTRDDSLIRNFLNPGNFFQLHIKLTQRFQIGGLGLHQIFMSQADFEQGPTRLNRFAPGDIDIRDNARHGSNDPDSGFSGTLDDHGGNGNGAGKRFQFDGHHFVSGQADVFPRLGAQFQRTGLIMPGMVVIMMFLF